MRPRTSALYSTSADARSLQASIIHSTVAPSRAMMPKMNIGGYVTRPTTTRTPPTAATIGQRLPGGVRVAAGDSVSAAVSIAETSASRM